MNDLYNDVNDAVIIFQVMFWKVRLIAGKKRISHVIFRVVGTLLTWKTEHQRGKLGFTVFNDDRWGGFTSSNACSN